MRSLARLVRASAGLALTCLGSRVGALHPLPHRLLLPAMIGGDVTTEFLRDVHDEVILNRGAVAAEHDDSEHIIQGLGECVDALSPRDATMQPLSEPGPDGEDDDDDIQSCSADDDSGRDDDDDDDDDDALMSPFSGDAPAGPPLRGGEAPGTAAPALDPR